jgi:hypothetical protein
VNWKILRESCSGPFQDTTSDLIKTTNNIDQDSGYLGGYSNRTIGADRISSGGGGGIRIFTDEINVYGI